MQVSGGYNIFNNVNLEEQASVSKQCFSQSTILIENV